MSKRRKGPSSPVVSETAPGEGQGKGAVQLNAPERSGGVTGKGFKPGQSGNPGGVSKEKRAFLERLKSDDADDIYEAFMDGVKAREWSVVLRAVEYLAGKPAAAAEDRKALEKAGVLSFEQLLQALATKGGNDAG